MNQSSIWRFAIAAVVATAVPRAFPAETVVPVSMFATSDPDLEVTLWASSPDIKNPTNFDTDQYGRVWVAEGVDYRRHYNRQPEGDRIQVLQDTDGDGKADKSWTFVQEPALRAPMGIAVIDNKVIVSMAPDIIVYTDVNRDGKFDPAIDKREVLLTGFNGRIHDHTIHSNTVGPDGDLYFNAGNCGAQFADHSGRTFRIGSSYDPYYGSKPSGDLGWDPRKIAGSKSDDGRVWIGGFAARMGFDGSDVHIIGHNFRNSYEQAVTSYGDVFQSDNDDPPACRTAFLIEGGNAGFCSFDGKRSWGADRRPGQTIPIAEWRQEDPGTMPAGDVYGGGSPTGMSFVEDSRLGKKYRGLLLSGEPGRNTVFGYLPKPEGAGYKLERFDFLTSNREGKFAGGDFKGGDSSVSKELNTYFRPSDVTVGADGAIYVADFFDPRVGGHNDMDDTLSGAIYRIAPRHSKVQVPKVDLTTLEGAVAALRSSAVNVRGAAFYAVLPYGTQAIKPVSKLLKDGNPYVRARAVWLLPQLGVDGVSKVQSILKDSDAQMRVVALRSLRRHYEKAGDGGSVVTLAKLMAGDASPAVRREAGLALRDQPYSQSESVLMALAKQYDGQDRWILESIGIPAAGHESEFYDRVAPVMGNTDPLGWSPAFARLAWRLHPPQSAAGFRARLMSDLISLADRKAAMTALAYIGSREAVQGIVEAAVKAPDLIRGEALWWLLNRKDNAWKAYDLDAELKTRKIYDPDEIEVVASTMPDAPSTNAPSMAEVVALKGDPKRGHEQMARCYMCHRVAGEGNDVGPDLTGFGRAQTSQVIIQSILDPSADISQGFGANELVTTNGVHIEGLILSYGNPVVIRSAGGLTQLVPASRIASRKPLGRSLMWTPQVLDLKAQDVADITAYLKSLR